MQKTAYGMRMSDWSSDVCSSDLAAQAVAILHTAAPDARDRHLAGVLSVVGADDAGGEAAAVRYAEPRGRNCGVRRLVAQRFPQARDAVALLGGAEQPRHDAIVVEILAELLVDLGGGRQHVLEQLLEQPPVDFGEGLRQKPEKN